jgi:hypothetical protein
MWCAYLFALLALLGLPQAAGGGLLAFVQWLSQTFIQLVMLSVISRSCGSRRRLDGR